MLDSLTSSLADIINQTRTNLPDVLRILGVVWVIFILTQLTHRRLLYLGIIPRHLEGIPGILFAPFLHADFNHLFFNSIPLAVLSNFLLMRGQPYYLNVSLEIILISGGLTWCFAKQGIHVGASSVITGYWALLVMDIYQQGTVTAIILGLICLYYFAGIFYAIFPSHKGVSWEGHLFGLIAGVLTSYTLPFSY